MGLPRFFQARHVVFHPPVRLDSTSPLLYSSSMAHTKLEIFGFEQRTNLELPLYLATVPAGFPSPAEDYIDKELDLNEHLVKHPSATFFVRVAGDSMRDAGISPGDILVVDRAVEAQTGHIVIAALDGELTVKRLRKQNGRLFLIPDNPEYAPMEISSEASFQVWGVVTYIIHKA